MSIIITLPDKVSDETAARIRDFLHELGDAFYELGGVVETRYGTQIRRYYQPDYPATPRRRGTAAALPGVGYPALMRRRTRADRAPTTA